MEYIGIKIFKLVAFLLVCLVLFLSSCGHPPIDDSVIDESSEATVQDEVEHEPVIDSEPKPIGPYEYILDSDFNRENGVAVPKNYTVYGVTYTGPDTAFDISELDKNVFISGEWSVNEIEEKFGKANEVIGYLEYIDQINIVIEYEDIKIVLSANKTGVMSFDTSSNGSGEYSLSEQDREIRMPVSHFYITGECSYLPRGIKIGDAFEHVRSAYPENTGYEFGIDYGYWIILYLYVDFDKIAMQKSIQYEDFSIMEYYSIEEGPIRFAKFSWRTNTG